MDIFVGQVPEQATNRQLQAFFKTPLELFGIHTFQVEKIKNKSIAFVTVIDTDAGQRFISHYSKNRQTKLTWSGRHLTISRAHNTPDKFALQSLKEAAAQRQTHGTHGQSNRQSDNPLTSRFRITGLSCGLWDYANKQLVFVHHYESRLRGEILFGRKSLIITLGSDRRVDIDYYNCDSIVLGDQNDAVITLSLIRAPKFYTTTEMPYDTSSDDLTTALRNMVLGLKDKNQSKKYRLCGIDETHEKIAGTCLVYRVKLADSRNMSMVRTLKNRIVKLPATLSLPMQIVLPPETLKSSWQKLNHELTDAALFGKAAFSLRFQLHKLASFLLSPPKVILLIPTVSRLVQKYGLEATLSGLGAFSREVPLAGPQTNYLDFSLSKMEELLEDCTLQYGKFTPSDPYQLVKRHTHINLIHKVVVTPTGTYLSGPSPEPTNRVLRKYAEHTDCFIRVVFEDEDGSSVRYDPQASQELIYHGRFKSVLDSGIVIAGKGFKFLGFSHSSLRSRTCWFMSPLVLDSRLALAAQIILELGDFTHIRSPAKCAARIGQNFTDTNATVILDQEVVGELPVVTRNGRDFSDGVGTISQDLLREVWRKYGTKRLLKPTALQIRFQGSKGMVSLDTRLAGRKLMIRENMRKFETTTSWDLEICGAGFRPLPMVLNRQLISVLEDLGVSTTVFLALQKEAVADLRAMTASAIKASAFLQEGSGLKATKTNLLISQLDEIGLDYRQSPFLRGVVEMAVISKLRDIKYRGRVPVKSGCTLYGVMDETNTLCEGEVHIVTEQAPEGGRRVIVKDRVVITRSPVMHPGDVQIVKAIDVPRDSPLYKLRNVVVFSQQGNRDLPSQLSGGDLDGDIFHIIYDERLFPTRLFVAADYPRVPAIELDRAVTTKDMSDFFVKFMETDVLGMLCNIHLQLADRSELGTVDAKCTQLAAMASTAVDFSKTGIPVNMAECPRYDNVRPDFMSPSPRIFASASGFLELEDDEDKGDGYGDSVFEGIEPERRPYRYYQSDKALGHLYREIDEKQFITNLQREHRQLALPGPRTSGSLISQVLAYMRSRASKFGILSDHHLDLARDIKFGYEDSLLSVLYNFSPSDSHPITEIEAFSGEILGRQAGAQGKTLRDLSKSMRERCQAIAENAIMRIVKGDAAMEEAEYLDELYDEREIEALPRALACLTIAVEEPSRPDRQLGQLESFQYIAAQVCLSELERYYITTFGARTSLPRTQRMRPQGVTQTSNN